MLTYKRCLQVLSALLVAVSAPISLQAATVTASGPGASGAQLSAQASFDIAGDNLTITLKNIATSDEGVGGKDSPGNTLTGLFFDIAGSPTLTTVSATIPSGSAIAQANKCDVATCTGVTDVSGEWGFSQTQNFSTTGGPSAGYGVSSAGYLDTGLSGNVGNFNNGVAGTNLDDPTSVDGINFGIISSLGTFDPNGGLKKDPLIQDSLVLVFSGATGLSMSDFSNISFQYGTAFGEPLLSAVVPLPGAVWLFGTGLLALVSFARRRPEK